MPGAGRRIRLRQIGHGAVDPQAPALSGGAPSVGQHRVPRQRHSEIFRTRDAPGARRRHHHRVPGADDVAQSAAHDREADRRNPAAAPRPDRRGGARAHPRSAHPGRHSRPGDPAQELSASALRRPAPARDDRHGARQRARSAHRRRADHRARRHRAGADHRAAEGHPVAAPHVASVHHPRSRHRAQDRAARLRDEGRQDRRARHRRAGVLRAAAPLYAALLAAEPRPDPAPPQPDAPVVLEPTSSRSGFRSRAA